MNDGLAGARKHLHTLIGTRQHSLISGEGGRSCLTAVHFVLLRCHYLTARIKEVTKQGVGREGASKEVGCGGWGGRPVGFAPPVSFIGSLWDRLHPSVHAHNRMPVHTHKHTLVPVQTEQLHTSTGTRPNRQRATNIRSVPKAPVHMQAGFTHTHASLGRPIVPKVNYNLLCKITASELITETNAGKQWLISLLARTDTYTQAAQKHTFVHCDCMFAHVAKPLVY